MCSMAGKISRKGKNPGPIDAWLDNLGFYRKNVAYDETCLFRAVAEQLFSCQMFHERVRKECISYAEQNFEQLSHIFSSREEWRDRLKNLATHMAICGSKEIVIVSQTYRRNIVLFDGIQKRLVEIISDDNKGDVLLLCLMTDDHYDVVYKKEYIQTAGFCQSIMYNILYEKVFEIQQTSSIVQAMLYDKPPLLTTNTDYFSKENIEIRQRHKILEDNEGDTAAEMQKMLEAPFKPENMSHYEYMLQTNLAPFPFKIAKALDPTIYRNIEYDTWTEIRKEMRLGDWYYGDNNLILGTKCIFQENGDTYQCYIQEILKETNSCVVFITSNAEKRTVKYSDLKPECNAQPWPIPYRFSKNVLACSQKEIADKEKRGSKKRKDKKRSSSKSSNESGKCSPVNGFPLKPINAYEGYPLQMQSGNEETETDTINSSSECYNNNSALPWHNNQWEPPNTSTIYSYPPKLSSGNGNDITYPAAFCYYEDGYRYNVWNSGEGAISDTQSIPTSPTDMPMSPEQFNCIYYPENTYSTSAAIVSPKICGLPMTPASPQVEMYHPPIFPQPGTPVIYASPEHTEVVMPPPLTPITILSPPPMEYLQTQYCVIPSTPPAWYPPGINTHGFIFPTPAQSQNVSNRM